jgi:hypothetical protein
LRFAALALVLTFVTTGIVNRPAKPDPPHVAVQATQELASDAVATGFDAVKAVDGAEMVGLSYDVAPGSPEPTVEVRGQRDGQWTEWLDISAESDDGPDADSPEFHGDRRSTAPAWLGHDQQQVEVRVTNGTVSDLQLHPVDSEPATPSGDALALPAADAFVSPGPITMRSQWGADEANSYTQPGCESGPTYAPQGITDAIVHHTVNSNTYSPSDSAALVRGIQAYHIFSNGWCDIGYNFLVDRYGQVFEGRRGGIGRAVVGAHASGFNTGSTGVSLIGDFTNSGVPNAAYAALVQLLTWKLAYHGTPAQGQVWVRTGANSGAYWPEGTYVAIDRIIGHRDVNATGCPGNFMWWLLPQLRADVAAGLASQPREQRLVCDWDGNGTDTPAVFYNGSWAIRNANSEGATSIVASFGDPGDIAVCGDWLGTGRDTIGVYRSGRLYMKLSNTSGVADLVFAFGNPGDRPVVGDWNGDGIDTLAVVRGADWYMTNSYLPYGTAKFRYGDPGDIPIAGDWSHKGYDTPGVVRDARYYLSDHATSGFADYVIIYGDPYDIPLVGDFNGDRVSTPGVNRGVYWWLSDDFSGNATYVFPY